ncbi:MAG: hypothetical protein M3041_09870 [Acidobacteriota bacterium]|nr:hypothetical protein [Acidobacteriota bacterium]
MRRTLAAALILAGCATVINDQKETIAVRSEPAGAVVTVDCGSSPMYGGLTPASIIIDRTADPCAFTIAKDGYGEQRVELTRKTSGATRGNKVAGVVAGSLLYVVGLLATSDSSWIDPFDAAQGGWEIGSAIGEKPGNAIDRKTGAAYKHFPGKVFVKLDPQQTN